MQRALVLLVLALGLASVSPSAAQTVELTDLTEAIRAGTVRLVSAQGTGASTGTVVIGTLRNQTRQRLRVGTHLRSPLHLRNSGVGQDMTVIQVYGRDMGYFIEDDDTFIELGPSERMDIRFVAFCAEFEKPDPAASETFTVAPLPEKLERVVEKLMEYAQGRELSDYMSAGQVAIWLAEGIPSSSIRERFESSDSAERLARQLADAPPPPSPPRSAQPPLPFPLNGAVGRFGGGTPVAPLNVRTQGLVHHFVKVSDWATDEPVATLFVRAGQSAQMLVPLGTYRIKYATGKIWYGEDDLFGDDTLYSEADKQFRFADAGDQYTGYTVELIPQEGGNLGTSRISPSEW